MTRKQVRFSFHDFHESTWPSTTLTTMKIDVSASFDPHVVLTEKLDGKAVIVGDKILTACHCIPLDFDREDRELTLQTGLIVKLQSASGDLFPANIEFADPISDVAILGTPNAKAISKDESCYEDCVSCSPIEVYFGDLPTRFSTTESLSRQRKRSSREPQADRSFFKAS